MNYKKLSKIAYTMLFAITAQACNSLTKPQASPSVQPLPELPATLKAPCGESQELRTGLASEVLTLMIDDRRKLIDCELKRKTLVEMWESVRKEALN